MVGFVAEVEEQDDGANVECPSAGCHFCGGDAYEVEDEDADSDHAANEVEVDELFAHNLVICCAVIGHFDGADL